MNRFFILLFLFLTVQAYSQEEELRLASDIWPPFTNVETETSIALDIVTGALDRMNSNPAISIVGFDEVIPGIRQGVYDGSAALWLNEERSEFLVFSEPYLQNQLVLVGRKGSWVGYESLSELKDVKLGLVKGYAYGDDLELSANVEHVYGTSDQVNLEKLLSGSVDYLLVDNILIHYLLKYQVNDVTELLEIATKPVITKSLHLALRKDLPGVEQFISTFNDEVQGMITDGSYNAILGFNWIKADVDGDGQVELVLEGDKAGTAEPMRVYSIYAIDKAGPSDRYYIEGQIYNGWNNIPERYKREAMQGSGPDPNKVGFKL